MRCKRDVLSAVPSYTDDLSSVHWQEGWKNHNPQVQEEAFSMG